MAPSSVTRSQQCLLPSPLVGYGELTTVNIQTNNASKIMLCNRDKIQTKNYVQPIAKINYITSTSQMPIKQWQSMTVIYGCVYLFFGFFFTFLTNFDAVK